MVIVSLVIAVIYIILLLVKDRWEISTDIINFQAGIFAILEIFLISTVLKNVFAMKNNAKLQSLYIKEYDERNIMIQQKTGFVFLPICAIGFGITSIMVIYFSHTVFFTLLGVIGFMALVKIILRLYFGRKY